MISKIFVQNRDRGIRPCDNLWRASTKLNHYRQICSWPTLQHTGLDHEASGSRNIRFQICWSRSQGTGCIKKHVANHTRAKTDTGFRFPWMKDQALQLEWRIRSLLYLQTSLDPWQSSLHWTLRTDIGHLRLLKEKPWHLHKNNIMGCSSSSIRGLS